MGMSIETQIKALEYLKNCGIFPFSDTKTGVVFDYECIDAAIETMRKYQKIEQILHNGFGKGVYAVFDEIVKVVEKETK